MWFLQLSFIAGSRPRPWSLHLFTTRHEIANILFLSEVCHNISHVTTWYSFLFKITWFCLFYLYTTVSANLTCGLFFWVGTQKNMKVKKIYIICIAPSYYFCYYHKKLEMLPKNRGLSRSAELRRVWCVWSLKKRVSW